MFLYAPGYYRIYNNQRIIKPERYYILCLLKIRKPYLLRVECKNAFLAKKYIILKTNPIWYEVIKGDEAIRRGFYITGKKLGRGNSPTKYAYPPECKTKKKRKQHRTNYRAFMREAFNRTNTLKQFTIRYRGKTYTAYHYTIIKGYRAIKRHTGMTWKHFIKHVSNKPYRVTKKTKFIKTVAIFIINRFNKLQNEPRIKYSPNCGKSPRLSSAYLSIEKPKPKHLIF